MANSIQSLTNSETQYSKSEREALGIFHSLEKFHHYCFDCKVSVMTDHKQLVAIFEKDVASLFTQTTKNNIAHPPIYHKNSVQTRTTTIHSRLAIQAQPQDRQR